MSPNHSVVMKCALTQVTFRVPKILSNQQALHKHSYTDSFENKLQIL